jgi:hypothetical protein
LGRARLTASIESSARTASRPLAAFAKPYRAATDLASSGSKSTIVDSSTSTAARAGCIVALR